MARQAKAHNLYPYITFDDALNGRIHPGDCESFADAMKDITKPGDSQ
jgi:hypothetical protein